MLFIVLQGTNLFVPTFRVQYSFVKLLSFFKNLFDLQSRNLQSAKIIPNFALSFQLFANVYFFAFKQQLLAGSQRDFPDLGANNAISL